jgi:hypothetical protein
MYFLLQQRHNQAMLRDCMGKGMSHWLLEWYVVMQLGLFAQTPWTHAVKIEQLLLELKFGCLFSLLCL